MSLLGIRLRTSRSDGSRFPETGDLGTPRALSSDRQLLRGGRLGASSPGLGCSPLGTERTRNRASLSLYLGLSFCDPWERGLRVLVCGIQTRSLVGSLRSRVPDLALGARSWPLSPGLSRRPRPNPLSPGSFCSLWPRGWPSGPPTLQTWARFRSPACSLPPPLARCRALTWRLSSQLRVIFFLS